MLPLVAVALAVAPWAEDRGWVEAWPGTVDIWMLLTLAWWWGALAWEYRVWGWTGLTGQTGVLASSPGFFIRRNQAHQFRRIILTWEGKGGEG